MEKTISSKLLEQATGSGWIGRNFGGDIRKGESDRQMLIIKRHNTWQAENAARAKEGEEAIPMPDDLASDLATLKSGGAGAQGLALLKKGAAAVSEAQAKGVSDATKHVTDAQEAWHRQIGGGNAASHEALDAAKKELADALAAAKVALKNHAHGVDAAKKKAEDGQDAALASMKTSVAGTFNGMRAGQILGGGDRVERAIQQSNRLLRKIADGQWQNFAVFGQ
jgi:hypothetical protein